MSEKINSELQDSPVVSGSLDSTTVPHLIVLINKGKKTGKLKISSFRELLIYFDQGTPFYAVGGEKGTKIGEILLSKGKITKHQYNKVIEEISNDSSKHIGELLVSLGIVSPHELNEYLELQIKEKILDSLLYTEGKYEFSSLEEIPKEVYYCKINSSELICEGFKRYVDSSSIDFSNFDFEVSQNINDESTSLGLGPKEFRVVQLISKGESLSQIEKSGVLSKEEIFRLVLLLNLYYLLRIDNFSTIDYLRKSFSFKSKEILDSAEIPAEVEEETVDSNDVAMEKDGVELDSQEKVEEVVSLDNEYLDKSENEPAETIDSNDLVEEADSEAGNDVDTISHTEAKDEESDEELDSEKLEEVTEIKESLDIENNKVDEKIDQPVLAENNEESTVIAQDEDSKSLINPGEFVIDDEFFDSSESIDVSKYTNKEQTQDNSEDNLKSEEKLNIEQETPLDTESSQKSSDFNEIKEFFEYIVKEEDYYKILDVRSDSTSDDIRASYFKLIKQYHPDANPDFPDDIRVKAEQIFTKVTKAYEILYDEEKRREYELSNELDEIKGKANSIYEAEVIYNEGELYLRQRNYEEAVKCFSRAIELNSEEPAYLGILAWTQFLGSKDKSSIAEDIRKQLEKAISVNERIAENYYYLGSVFKYLDNSYKAKTNFEKAVELDRNYIEAKRELRLLENRKNQKKDQKSQQEKGNGKFWSGLFKK